MLYVFGANSYGQLGTGTQEDIEVAERVNIENIKTIKGGGNHTLIVDIFGKLYTSGLNNEGQLTSDFKYPDISVRENKSDGNGDVNFKLEFSLLDIDLIQSISPGYNFTYLITVKNKILYMGSCEEDKTSVEIIKDKKFKEISCGHRHAIALTDDGQVWVWGSNKFGQLGISNYSKKYNFPSLIHKDSFLGDEVVKVKSGFYFSLVLTKLGSLYGFGKNNFMQISDTFVNIFEPLLIDLPFVVLDLDCGWNFTVVKTSDNKLYGFGRNNYSQLGANVIHTENFNNKLYFILDNIIDFSCGADHVVALTSSGKAYTWGWNEHSNCAPLVHGYIISEPRLVEIDKIVKGVGTGFGNTFLIA